MPPLEHPEHVQPTENNGRASFDALRGAVIDIEAKKKQKHIGDQKRPSIDVLRNFIHETKLKDTDITECYDRTKLPIREIKETIDEGALKSYIMGKISDATIVCNSLESHKLPSPYKLIPELHNFGGSDQTRTALKNDLQFWKSTARLQEITQKTNMLIEKQGKYISKIEPDKYQKSVKEAKNFLEGIGVKTEVVDCVGDNIKKVSDALQDKMKGLKGDDLKNAKRILSLVKEDFRSEKFSDYDDTNAKFNSIQKEQLKTLQEHRHAVYAEIDKIDNAVEDAKMLTQADDKKEFIDNYSQAVKAKLSELEALLNQEIIPRHEAKRFVLNERDGVNERVKGIWSTYFDSSEWSYNQAMEKDGHDRKFDMPTLPAPCAPTSLARIFSHFDPRIRLGIENFRKKFEKIYNAHPRGEKGKSVGWMPHEQAKYLNDEIGAKQLRTPEGKDVQFKVWENFSYKQLQTMLSVKDTKGNYIPAILQVCSGSKETGELLFHAIVVHRSPDRDGEPDNHDFKFDVCDPYTPMRSTNPHGLANLLELTQRQGYDTGINDVWAYKSKNTGGNRAIGPVA